MGASFNLGRTKQCPGCPWRKAIDPNTIPNGFNVAAHQHVASAQQPAHMPPAGPLRITAMQCHDSPDNKPQYCVGWVHNQLATNIPLRMRMMACENLRELQVEGEQRTTFDELLTDALAMNPELEMPERKRECPECDGWGIIHRTEGMLRASCPACAGEGTIPVDEADARDDAAEARWEAGRGK